MGRVVYFAVVFVSFIEKRAFRTNYNFCKVNRPKGELQEVLTSFSCNVSCRRVTQGLKYSDK